MVLFGACGLVRWLRRFEPDLRLVYPGKEASNVLDGCGRDQLLTRSARHGAWRVYNNRSRP
jgi:hypothetical protein